jgi:hypothetical protein
LSHSLTTQRPRGPDPAPRRAAPEIEPKRALVTPMIRVRDVPEIAPKRALVTSKIRLREVLYVIGAATVLEIIAAVIVLGMFW